MRTLLVDECTEPLPLVIQLIEAGLLIMAEKIAKEEEDKLLGKIP